MGCSKAIKGKYGTLIITTLQTIRIKKGRTGHGIQRLRENGPSLKS